MIENIETTGKEKNIISIPKLKSSSSALIYLAVLLTLYTVYVSKTIMLPAVIAIFISFLAAPLLKYTDRSKIPRSVASFFIVLGIISLLGIVSYLFTTPAQHWWGELPGLVRDVHSSINELGEDLSSDSGGSISAQPNTQVAASGEMNSDLNNSAVMELIKGVASFTPTFIAQLLTIIFLIYFFLAYGKALYTRVIQLLPSLTDKKQATHIVHSIRERLSRYVVTITLINMSLGLVVGAALYILGVPDAFFWGLVAGILNFAPYVGPIISASLYFVIAYLHFENYTMAMITPAVYLFINLLECQFVTPVMLGKSLKLNPLVVFIWLIIWGWLWGVFGMLIAVPLLVCLLAVMENTKVGEKWYHLVSDE